MPNLKAVMMVTQRMVMAVLLPASLKRDLIAKVPPVNAPAAIPNAYPTASEPNAVQTVVVEAVANAHPEPPARMLVHANLMMQVTQACI